LTDIIRNGALLERGGRLRALPSGQGIMSMVTLVFCGGLVIYPIGYLVAESLNVGEPDVFPPTAYGVNNYFDLIDDWHVLANTAFVACLATVTAVAIGFLSAWTLTRTKLPGRGWLERLMELPYYTAGRRVGVVHPCGTAHRFP
jgi:iron(III) transport system permease protein